METFDRQKAIIAQRKLCEEKGYPHFAPENGVCWRCHKNIYDEIKEEGRDWRTGKPNGKFYTHGISVERAAKELVTGCPHCNRSYCD